MQTDDDRKPPLPDAHDVLAAIHLLEWARERGFRLDFVQVGEVKFRVADIRQAKQEGFDQPAGPAEPGTAYEAAGLKMEDEPVPGTF